LLSIDVGSTNIKAILFNIRGELVFSESMPMKDNFEKRGQDVLVYANPEYIWNSIVQMINRLVLQAKDAKRIMAVAVTGMGDDGVPVDCLGNCIYHCISWKCRRTVKPFEKFISEYGAENYFLKTGLQARTLDTIFKLLWLKEHEHDICKKTYKWLMLEDYINFKLCGKMVTDITIANTTGLFDITKKDWSADLLKEAGFDYDAMPDVRRCGEVIGKVTKDVASITGLYEETPVVLGGWDIQCAALALKASKEGSVVDTMGTWETVNIISDQLTLNHETYRNGFNACYHVVQDKYTYPVFLLSSNIVEWYIDNNYITTRDEKKAIADTRYRNFMQDINNARAGSGGLLFLPHISGGFFPGVDPKSRGAFLGISVNTQKKDFSRALIEGISYMTREVLETCNRIISQVNGRIVVSGGGVRNEAWLQIKADVYGRTIFASHMAEETALGAAMLAGIGIGLYTSVDDAEHQILSSMKEVGPVLKHNSIYNERFEIYKQIYKQLKTINHKISEMN